jgi:hypothetical protein
LLSQQACRVNRGFELGYAGLRPKTHLVFWMWTFATYISAMNTKQHYFLDILVGVTVINAALARALFEKKVKIWSS